MVREMVTVQVGQCGNQLGRLFWEDALEEHARHNRGGVFDDAMSSFFRNVDARQEVDPPDIPLGDGTTPISGLKARAVLVDTEDGPVAQTLRGPLGDLYDDRQVVTDVQSSGAGNNWAQGHFEHGPRHATAIGDAARRAAEFCDSLQCFFLMHSLGGGTGSGLGTFILSMLEDDFPKVFRFTTSVFPSEDDDVITSPYNSMLSLNELVKHADCVLPLENQQLADISARCTAQRQKAGVNARGGEGGASRPRGAAKGGGSGTMWLNKTRQRPVNSPRQSARNRDLFPKLDPGQRRPREAEMRPRSERNGSGGGGGGGGGDDGDGGRSKGFDGMNRVAAQLLTHLTSSMRFPGQLNTDMNEITTNLVPFPRLHFLVPALAPFDIGGASDEHYSAGGGNIPRAAVVRQLFHDAFSASHQLLQVDPKSGTYLANALLLRGELSVSDVNNCMAKLQPTLSTIHWNQDGFKVGLCSAAPLHSHHGVLSLSNNTCIATTFDRMHQRFDKLYSRRAMVHHYTQYMGEAGDKRGEAGDGGDAFGEAALAVAELIDAYRSFDDAEAPSHEDIERFVPFI